MVTTVFDIFFINPNTRPLFTFLPSPHGTRRRIQAWGPNHGRHPETPGRGPAPPSSCGARGATRGESPRDAHLHEQPRGAPGKAGEAGWGGADGLWGERWRSWTFHQGHFLFGQGLRPEFSFCFPVLLDDFWANQCTLIHVNESIRHGWTPIRRFVTFSRRWQPANSGNLMTCSDPHPRSCS